MPDMNDPAEYRRKAELCRRYAVAAKAAGDTEREASWLQRAADWEIVAELAEKESRQR